MLQGEEDFWLAGGAYDGLGILSTDKGNQKVGGENNSSASAEPSVEAPPPPSSSPFPSSSDVPHGMLEPLAPGEVARYTTVAVGSRSAASAFVKAYGEKVVPAASNVQGYKRGVLLHDALGSSVVSWHSTLVSESVYSTKLDLRFVNIHIFTFFFGSWLLKYIVYIALNVFGDVSFIEPVYGCSLLVLPTARGVGVEQS